MFGVLQNFYSLKRTSETSSRESSTLRPPSLLLESVICLQGSIYCTNGYLQQNVEWLANCICLVFNYNYLFKPTFTIPIRQNNVLFSF